VSSDVLAKCCLFFAVLHPVQNSKNILDAYSFPPEPNSLDKSIPNAVNDTWMYSNKLQMKPKKALINYA